jgi:23S rRNA pseudouridine2605 synthase
MNTPVRLQKYLAQCGVCSRRKAEEYIKNGRVKVDGTTVTEMGLQITPGSNVVRVDNGVVSPESRLVYILLNKPSGFVTTLSDPQGRPVVTSLIKDKTFRLFPVGRLDLDTEGALLLTNDGALAQKIQHPSHNTKKSYEALLDGTPSKKQITQLEQGIFLEGKMTSPAKIRFLKRSGSTALMQITIHEGRKRQVKKMFAHIGYTVIHLKRTAYGKLTLNHLGRGEYRYLNPSELKKIFL